MLSSLILDPCLSGKKGIVDVVGHLKGAVCRKDSSAKHVTLTHALLTFPLKLHYLIVEINITKRNVKGATCSYKPNSFKATLGRIVLSTLEDLLHKTHFITASLPG